MFFRYVVGTLGILLGYGIGRFHGIHMETEGIALQLALGVLGYHYWFTFIAGNVLMPFLLSCVLAWRADTTLGFWVWIGSGVLLNMVAFAYQHLSGKFAFNNGVAYGMFVKKHIEKKLGVGDGNE